MHHLKYFDLSSNKLSDNGVLIFSEYLKGNNTLCRLRISWGKYRLDLKLNVASLFMCELHYGSAGAILISAFLYHNLHIWVLNISHNNIPDNGAIAISECLTNNNTLQELVMSHNKVSDEGIISIAKALQTNRALQLLDISYDNISDNGVLTFSDCLKGKI